MNNNSITEYGRYLTGLISSVINSAAPQKPFKGMDWERLYKLALLHNVAALVYPAIKELDPPEEVMKKFEYSNNRTLAREARQELEARRIFEALHSEGIKFIILKGTHLKNFYPLPHMRTQSDVDICMSKEDRARGMKLMHSFGYELDESIDYTDEYSKDNYFIYEFHSDIMSNKSEFHSAFSEPFSKAKPLDDDGMTFVFTDEYFYLHLFFHLYKHFISGGCGIRHFCDMYIFEKSHPDMDKEVILKVIKEYNTEEFYENLNKLLLCMFEGKAPDNAQEQILAFIFKSSEHGTFQVYRTASLFSKKTDITRFDQFKYLLGNCFPGVEVMKKRYPILEKAPVLLPVCWVRRGCYSIFCNREVLRRQKKELEIINSDEVKEAQNARHLIGIK